ncbi:MAG: gamma-glutamyl-gamma-aminobutyrate hydrolase family protein, partial [Nocardioidaceae bacterium]
MTSARPVIGITSYVEPASWAAWKDVPAALIPHGYVRHVHEAGGLAVIVPPLPDDATDDDAHEVLSRLDGLILAGGVDVEPARYGQDSHPTVQLPRPDRDASELLLAKVTAAYDVPLLGVCRGMQVMAVAAGGELEQHLP